MEEIAQKFAERLEIPLEKLIERWDGKPENMAEDLFRVEDMDTGEYRDLELFNVQKKVMQAYFFGNADTLNLYKGRRIGYSYVISLCFLLEGLMKPESNYAFVSRQKGQAEDRISDIQTLIDKAKIDIPQEKDNQDEIVLWNGSSFLAYSGDSDGSRGADSARAVMMDEMAFIEDQVAADRAFGSFVALGSHRTMVQVSTPNAPNDLFMQSHREGSKSGYIHAETGEAVGPDHEHAEWSGTISIKQPSFYNADGINVNVPLQEQELEPVRPDMNIAQIENQRKRDPIGFGQEYLCRPVDDTYKFFSETSIEQAMSRKPPGSEHGHRVMGVDIGIDHDDTVITVFEHREGGKRYMRHFEVVTNELLQNVAGIQNPDRGNANDIAARIAQVKKQYDVDHVVLDKTGPGETFQRIIERKLGRGVIGFNFSDKDAVRQMMGDLNANLREGNVTLKDNDLLYDHLRSIVKEQKEDWQKPKFTGKEYSEDGKDDAAMATILGAYPPEFAADKGTSASQKQRDVTSESEIFSRRTHTTADREEQQRGSTGAYSSARATRRGGSRKSYSGRHAR